MTDFNGEAERILSALECETAFRYPESFKTLPVVSYYTLTEKPLVRADNAELVQEGYLQVDIWAKKPSECGGIAVRVNELMENAGWSRQFSMDLKKEDGERVYHRTMRFAKACAV